MGHLTACWGQSRDACFTSVNYSVIAYRGVIFCASKRVTEVSKIVSPGRFATGGSSFVKLHNHVCGNFRYS